MYFLLSNIIGLKKILASHEHMYVRKVSNSKGTKSQNRSRENELTVKMEEYYRQIVYVANLSILEKSNKFQIQNPDRLHS